MQRPAGRFAFTDFDCTISTPWGGDEIELAFDDRHRAAWSSLPVSGVETSEDDDFAEPPPLDEEGNEIPTVPDLRSMEVALGTVSAERHFADGTLDAFADVALELYLEPGPWAEIRRCQKGRGTTLWSTRFEKLFVRVVSSLCEPVVPPAVKLPPPEPRRCTAAALLREGWADDGAELACRDLEDHWNPGTEIDVSRLLAAIEAGETHRRARGAPRPDAPDALIDAEWAVSRDADGSLRLVTPLAMEVLRVEVVGHPAPGFLTARYYLVIALDARGEVEDVSIRAARDGTFDAEGDDSTSMFAERDPADDRERLRGQLSYLAYCAVSWVMEDFVREERSEEDAAPERE